MQLEAEISVPIPVGIDLPIIPTDQALVQATSFKLIKEIMPIPRAGDFGATHQVPMSRSRRARSFADPPGRPNQRSPTIKAPSHNLSHNMNPHPPRTP